MKCKMYKYKSLKCRNEIEHLKDSLQQKIWMPRLESINDPFEGFFKLKSSPGYVLKDKKLRDFFFNRCKKNNPDLTDEGFKDCLRSPEFENDLNSNQKLYRELFTDYSVFSLTNCPSNIPMWSHYGNQHQGICIIFKVDLDILCGETKIPESILNGAEIGLKSIQSKDGSSLIWGFSKVKYEKEPAILCFETWNEKDKFLQTEYVLEKVLAVKFHQWSYEQEYRLIANKSSAMGDLMPLNLAPFLSIAGVIIGVNAKFKDEIECLCQEYRIDLYQAHCSSTEYKITIGKVLDHGHKIESLEPVCNCKCLCN